MLKRFNVVLLIAVAGLTGCQNLPFASHKQYSQFIGLTDFTTFAHTENEQGEAVWLSQEIPARAPWNQLVLSWNVSAPAGTFLKVEACALSTNHATKFFSLGTWSPDDAGQLRASVTNQADLDGDVRADTLALTQPAASVQVRLTFGGTNATPPQLKFLSISFCNTLVKPAALPPNRAAWGKELPVIERSQQSYPGGNGWCSPTSLSMVLNYWATKEAKPEWNVDAPEVAAGVSDHGFKFLTGNWTFNTAFAGTLPGLRAYVTRFSDITELEAWIAAGIPVIISARYDLLQDGRADDFSGHLTVCRGFTKDGDLIINDPWSDLKVESVRHIYKRENVRRAWATSRNTVYLVYPEGTKIPPNKFGHWE
jgi:hypothetical protein